MISNARGNHVSPGVYMKEIDIPYAVKSLGITTLGVVGETLKGPAFEPIRIHDWAEFQEYFGATSTEKFRDSGYPKYELPYIAKSYLEESKQLDVCRVLGLSGYNAGPAYIIYQIIEDTPDENQVVCVLRSRGEYNRFNDSIDPCSTDEEFDKLVYSMKDYTVSLEPYTNTSIIVNGCNSGTSSDNSSNIIDKTNFGRYNLTVKNGDEVVAVYPVSFNPADKNYIIKVLGMKQDDGDSMLYVEELYDVAISQNINDASEDRKVKGYGIVKTDVIEKILSADDIMTIRDTELTENFFGKTYVADKNAVNQNFKYEAGSESSTVKLGHIYTVSSKKIIEEGEDKKEKTVYFYKEENTEIFLAEGHRYIKLKDKGGNENKNYVLTEDDVVPAYIGLYDYKEQFRSAMTPWIVSEIKGIGDILEVKKLFRFHTISDGNAANEQVKISITNIRPDEGLFDVLIRAFYDVDADPIVYERYNSCSMQPGTPNYIGLKIGTYNGDYDLKSKYVTVEVIENDATSVCVPSGFLGYPVRNYGEIMKTKLTSPTLKYNTTLDEDLKARKQFFGMSNLKGVDVDVLNYKGVDSYSLNQNKENGYTNGFHLDSSFNKIIKKGRTEEYPKISVDGEYGYVFDTVDINSGESGMNNPVIGSEKDMSNTIYKDVNLRKFTVYPYGGFDGWDIYRGKRTNTDDFKYGKYKGIIDNNFAEFTNPEVFGLGAKSFSSDFYAYLGGYNQFDNPQRFDINLLATPGIDYVNNKLLVKEVIDLVETKRMGDCLYIVTTPDKKSGATDFESDMFTPEEVVSNLEDTEIDSSYTATYYPWVKYYDSFNSKYIFLPVTKDVVRDMANTDNKAFPWISSAGTTRGNVECTKAHMFTKLEDEDILYKGRINPVKTFAKDGVKIWGNKTLNTLNTPTNRINTRRLVIETKKLVSSACKGLIFEQQDATIKNQFISIVDPILASIQRDKGIKEYKILVDDSVEARDQHTLPAKIWIKPIGALEYIDITFVITPEGANFED